MNRFLPNWRRGIISPAIYDPAAEAPPADGPPAQGDMWSWWRGDSLVGTTTATAWTDKSANARNLTVSGSPGINASGLNSKKIAQLSSASHRYFYHNTLGTLAQPFTVGSVARTPGGGGRGEFLYSAGFEGDGELTAVAIQYEDMLIEAFSSSGYLGNFAFSANTWYSIVVVFDGANSKLYLDGVERISGDVGSTGIFEPFGLGQLMQEPTSEFNWGGDIAEFAIWEKVLDGTERTAWETYVADYYAI